MNKINLLLLITAMITSSSKLIFSQNFPVNIRARVMSPAPEYILEINNLQREYCYFNFGNMKLRELKNFKFKISIRDQNGHKVPVKKIKFMNSVIDNNNGKVIFFIDNENQNIYANFIPKRTGNFYGKTVLNISM